MKFSVCQQSHQGGRRLNEDAMSYRQTPETVLLVVADGMGGHPLGEVAAGIAIQTVVSLFEAQAKPVLDDVSLFLEVALLSAHRQILRYAIDRGMADAPRTTLVAAVVQQGQVQWIHCGDSRFYLFRNQAVLTRTRDHSYAQLRDSVIPDMTEVGVHVLFTCLGSPSRPIYDMGKPEVLHPGDRLLLCSDGLWGTLDDEALAQRVFQGPLEGAVVQMVRDAFHAAGKSSDNITAVALDWQEPQKATADNSSSQTAFDLANLVPADILKTLPPTETMPPLLDDADIERSLRDIGQALQKPL